MATTIYFAGAITGGRSDVGMYRQIVDALRAAGHRVLAGAVASEDLGDSGEPLTAAVIHGRDVGWIGEAAAAGGVLVAEVTQPSTGVGYEIATARHRFGMRVICLFRNDGGRRCSAMIEGDAGIQLLRYDGTRVNELLDELGKLLG